VRVAFVSTHPIQYHAPWFRALAAEPQIDLEVLYCHNATSDEQADAGFGVRFDWDVSLFDGYEHRFLRNVAKAPTIARFAGLDTPEIGDVVHRARYDAIVVNGWHYKSAWQATRAAWREHVPVLVRSDSNLRTTRHPLARLAKAAPYRWFIPRLDGCLAVGRWSSEYFRHYGARADRVFIVPHAVSPSFGHDSASLEGRKAELRAQWRLSASDAVFLFVGKFVAMKRPMDFVRAIQAAAAHREGIAGLMVGDGPMRAECEHVVRHARVPVRFAGFLNQSAVVQAYVAADALVVPSTSETWGLVVNEAMSCGRGALVSDAVGSAPDLIEPGATGFVFPAGDVDALCRKLVACASDRHAFAALGANAKVRIAGHAIPAAVRGLKEALSRVTRH
jgi:glycosyltransferase involved in cell wall biosynthesis